MLFSQIQAYIKDLASQEEILTPDRKASLDQLKDYAQQRINESQENKWVFICTHNSRRSHFGQVWAQALADFYGISNFSSYSGGTEATAFNANAIQALKEVGFIIEETEAGTNPVYSVAHSDQHNPSIAFSKVFDHKDNPQEAFAAIMTCSEADAACPFVPGAEFRLSLPFEDPKLFDGTPQQEMMYAERCRQIASELNYVFAGLSQP